MRCIASLSEEEKGLFEGIESIDAGRIALDSTSSLLLLLKNAFF